MDFVSSLDFCFNCNFICFNSLAPMPARQPTTIEFFPNTDQPPPLTLNLEPTDHHHHHWTGIQLKFLLDRTAAAEATYTTPAL